MKLLLPYFLEFLEDSILVSKEYPSDYATKRPEKKPIIIIIQNEKIFFMNNNCKKIQTLNGQAIIKLKKNRKEIRVLHFLLLWSKLNLFSLFTQPKKDPANLGV